MPRSSQQSSTVLIVDDEDDILDLLTYNLQSVGINTLTARDGVEAIDIARRNEVDLIILDIMMPQMDGLEACRRIRRDSRLRQIPILFLTARSGEEDHIRGLDCGADSYLPKTSGIGVIISQVRALMRGVGRAATAPATLAVHDLEIDRDRFVVFRKKGDDRIELRFPRKEFELLHFLASSPGLVYNRQNLLDRVWGSDVYITERTVDVHVRKIREKLGSKYIETVKGVGYRFKAQA